MKLSPMLNALFHLPSYFNHGDIIDTSADQHQTGGTFSFALSFAWFIGIEAPSSPTDDI